MSEKRRKNILYIEDDEHLCLLFKTRMEQDGYKVDFSYSAETGLKKFYSGSYDLLTVDYDLPDKTGTEIVQEILTSNPRLPIIMVTGKGSEQVAAEALSVGVTSYFVKNGDETFLEKLPATISNLLKKTPGPQNHQEKFGANEGFYQALANFSPISIFVHADEKIIFVNPSAVKLLGAESPDELIGKDSLALIPLDHQELFRKRIEDVEKLNISAPPMEGKFNRQDGSLVDVETIGTMITFEGERARLVMAQDISERKRAETILRDTIESIPEGIAYYDADDRLALFNENFVKGRDELKKILKLNMTFEEQALLRQKFGLRDKYLGATKYSVKERIERHRNPGAPQIESQVDGRTIQIEEIKTASGGIAVIRTDVTDLQEALKKATNSESRLRALIENVPAAVNLKDTDGRMLIVNNIWREWFEPGNKDVLGKTGEEMYVTTHARQVRSSDDEVLKSGEIVEKETQTPLRDGTVRTTFLQKFPVRDSDGRIIAIGAINTDISERQNAREELQKAHDLLEDRVHERTESLRQQIEERKLTEEKNRSLVDLINAMSEPVALFDEEDRFIFTNESYRSMNSKVVETLNEKWTFEDHLRVVAAKGLVPEARGREDTWVSKRLAQHQNPGKPILLKRNDGEWMIFEKFLPGTGQITLLTNVTAQKNIERELIEEKARADEARENAETANQAKSEFLSSMSHELRTPMNAILGFGQMLEIDAPQTLTNEQKLCVDHILNGGKHLLELIDQVLDLAIIESGNLKLSLEDIALDEVCLECVSLVENQVREQGLSISSKLTPRAIKADYTRLKQVLLNLLSNAIKYNRDDGHISVSIEDASNDMVRVSVTDTGNGIPEEQQAFLFEPFNRLGKEGGDIEGSGIGLTITKTMVEAMGGGIGVESSVGRGSTFWLDFPSVEFFDTKSLLGIEGNSNSAPEGPSSTTGIILYVEDNPANVDLMKMIIGRTEGLSMITAHNAERGITMAEEDLPDLILMDINLPGMSGIEAMRTLQNREKTKNIPVIAITAAAMERDIKSGEAAGFTAYLTKPFDVEEIVGTINRVLDAQ